MSTTDTTPARVMPRSLFSDGMGDLFEGFFRPARFADAGVNTPAIDVVEKEKAYVIKAEMPGVKKDDIEVTVHDGVLTLSAEVNEESEEKEDGRVIRRERRTGKFVRTMRLGAEVDESKVAAKYNDGVLEVTIPKTEETQPKKVAIPVS